MQLANNKPALTVWTTIPMSHNNISLQIYISNPDYDQSCGRFWEKQKHKKQKQNWGQCSSLFATLQYEATRHTQQKKKNCGAVTKSMSNCIWPQLYSSEHLSLSGLLWNHTQARAHGDTHTRTHTDIRAREHEHMGARAHKTHIHAGLNTEHGQSKAISLCALEREK